jgi:hypothetical protein
MTTAQAQSTSADPAGKPSARSTGRSRPALMTAFFLVTVALLLWAADWLARNGGAQPTRGPDPPADRKLDAAYGRDRRAGVSAAGPAESPSQFPN